MKLNRILVAVCISVTTIGGACFAQQAQLGRIQLCIANPDLVKAGEKLTFEVIAQNLSNFAWQTGEYSITIEIYDAQKKLKNLLEPLVGTVNVGAGENVIFYYAVKIPRDYGEQYFYKVNLYYKKDIVFASDFFQFSVTPIVVYKRPPIPVRISGNSILNFRSNSLKGPGGDFSLNAAGNVSNQNFSGNAFMEQTTDGGYKLNTILFMYYGRFFNLLLGDVNPVFSPLSFSSMTVRGLGFDGKFGLLDGSFIYGLGASPKESTSTSAGVFARYIYGVRAKSEIFGLKTGVSYLGGFDDGNSIKSAGQTTPANNSVIGVDVSRAFANAVEVGGEIAYSIYNSDVTATGLEKSDLAFRITSSLLMIPNLALQGIFYQINPDFTSMGSPSIGKDKRGFSISSNYPFPTLNLSILYDQYNDNLESDLAKITMTNRTVSAGGNLSFARIPPLNLYYILNQVTSDYKNIVDNYTHSISIGSSFPLGKTTLWTNYLYSIFTDLAKLSHDLGTNNLSVGVNVPFGTKFFLNTSTTLGDILDIYTGDHTSSVSASLGFNYFLIPDLFTLSGWGNGTYRIATSGATENLNTNFSLEGNYRLTKMLSLAFGYQNIVYQDYKNSANNTLEHLGTARLNVSF